MTAFLTQYLEQKLPYVIRKRFSSLYFDDGTYCPQVADIAVGAETISVEVVEHYGQAAIMTGSAQDAPMSEVKVGKDVYQVRDIYGACSFTDPEVRASEMASSKGQLTTNFRDERLVAMRRMIDVKSHQLCAYGSSKHDIFGILNHPEVPLSNTSTYKLYAGNATAKNIVDFIANEYYTGWSSTNYVELPNALYIPPSLFKLLNTTFRSDTTGDTLMDVAKKVMPSIRVIAQMPELASAELEANGVHAGSTGKDRLVFLNLSSENVVRHFAPMYVMPPVQQGMRYNIYAYKRVSSVQFDYPRTARYADFPIATTNN
jgi:hypothetical protein